MHPRSPEKGEGQQSAPILLPENWYISFSFAISYGFSEMGRGCDPRMGDDASIPFTPLDSMSRGMPRSRCMNFSFVAEGSAVAE
jgi:hypothetical protein